MRNALPIVLYVVALVARPSTAYGADDYDDAMTRARAAERRGDPSAAARILEPVARAYTQDYEVALALAWARFQAGEYDASERAYRLAVTRAPSSDVAHLGLAWAIARQGRCDDAKRELGAYAADPRAHDVVDACARPTTFTLSAAASELFFPSHPYKTSATAVIGQASVDVRGWTVGGAYRAMRVQTSSPTLAAFDQNEGYAHAGYWNKRVGLLVRGAIVRDGSGYAGTSKHAGLSGHVALLGDVLLDATLSVYDDRTIGRVAATWVVPIAGPLRLAPGVAAQRTSTSTLGNASLALFLDWSPLALWAGAKYGEEERPAYLSSLVVYDVAERIAYGAWAGAAFRVGGVTLKATYAFDQLRRTDALSPHESAAHAFTVGPAFTF